METQNQLTEQDNIKNILNSIKEAIEVSVNVNEEEEKIKDLIYRLNTFDEAYVETTTEVITGILKCVILQSNKPINIKIALEEYPDIVLFETPSFQGTRYLPLKADSISKDGERFNFAPEKWYLNNAIRITIKGQMNSETKVILRYV